MEEVSSTWLDKMEDALGRKEEQLTSEELPALRDHITLYQTYFESLYNVLLRKSLLSEDPYKYDEKIAEVTVPSNAPFMDSEKQEQMSQRLASYHSQLEFLSTYYQFSIDFLDLKRVKRIADLLSYINWSSLNSFNNSMVSRTLSEYIARVVKGNDAMSAQITGDSLNQVVKATSHILNILNDLALFHKEKYKLLVRKNVLPKLAGNKKDSKDGLKEVKQIFPKIMPGQSFYPELVNDVLKEEFTPEGADQKELILKKIEEKLQKAKKDEKAESQRTILLQAIRFLASSGFQLEDAISKLTDNNVLVANKRIGLWARVRRWMQKVFKGGQDKQAIEIEYFDVATASTKTEKINFDAFVDEIQRKAKLYTSLTSRGNMAFKRLKTAPEDKIFEFLRRNISELQIIHRRLMGFHDYFRAEAAEEDKTRVRGLKVELSAIKNSIVKANQKRHEYVAVKEEQEQMKRLGMKMSNNPSPGNSVSGPANGSTNPPPTPKL
jgi:hypothetical protein